MGGLCQAQTLNKETIPLLWIRGSSTFNIESYRRNKSYFSKKEKFHLNEVYLYDLDRIIAVYHASYWRQFVYVETKAMSPTGVQIVNIKKQREQNGYAFEEYGEWGVLKKRAISRQDYDDGATVINGKVKNVAGKVRLQIKCLTKFNFLIVPIASPINNGQYDEIMDNLLNQIIKNKSSISDLADFIFKLPKNNIDI